MIPICLFFSGCSTVLNSSYETNKAGTINEKLSDQSKLSHKSDETVAEYDRAAEAQEESARREEEQKTQVVSENTIQLTINKLLDELLSLNPFRDTQRIQIIIKDLNNIGEKALEALEMLLQEERPAYEKILLIKALSVFKNMRATEEIYNQACNSKDKEIRAVALSKLKDSPFKKFLVSKVVDNLEQIENAQAERDVTAEEIMNVDVLGVLGTDQSINKLNAILFTSPRMESKKAAINALGQIGGDQARSVLFDALNYNDDTIKILAAQTLGSMKQEKIVFKFGEIVLNDEKDPQMRLAAVEGLGADNSTLAHRVLLDILKDARQPKEVHQGALNMLLRGYESTTIDTVYDYARLFETTGLEYLPQMLQPLLAMGGDYTADLLSGRYHDLDYTKRVHAVKTLGRIHSDHAFQILFDKIYEEHDPNLRQELMAAMKTFKGQVFASAMTSVLKWIAKTSQEKQEQITALRYLGEISPSDALAIAEEKLYIEDSGQIIEMIEIFKKYGNSQNKDALLTLKSLNNTGEFDQVIDEAISEIESREESF